MIEAALAHRIETELTKEQILEAYMNRIYFGSGYYGVETASRAYFGKPASLMNLPESAMLAGLIRSPNRFSPFNNLKKAVRERNAVLTRMRKLGFITEQQMVTAMASTPEHRCETKGLAARELGDGFHLRELELVIDRDQFDNGGLRIYTTIDGALQNVAEASLRKRLLQIESLPGFPAQADEGPIDRKIARRRALSGRRCHRDRQPDRRNPGDRGRQGLRAQQVQPGHAWTPSDRLCREAVCLCQGLRSRV